jgi:hypothetical protein
MKLFNLLLFILLLSSCNNDNKQKTISTEENEKGLPINDYIRKFTVIQLPFYFNGWNGYNIDTSKFFTISQKSIDTLFYKIENDEIVYGYGLLADTSNYYSLLYFGQADDIYPMLATYSKKGQLISKSNLLVNGCGSDCGLKYCSYSALIKKDFSIYIADTAKYEGICDSLGNYSPNSDSTFINSKTGKIDKSGNIKLEAETRQSIKNSRKN